MEGNLHLKIDWASLIVGGKFTIFALLYFVFEGQFSNFKPPGELYLEGRFNREFFTLPVWGAYIWRGLFSEFYGIFCSDKSDVDMLCKKKLFPEMRNFWHLATCFTYFLNK